MKQHRAVSFPPPITAFEGKLRRESILNSLSVFLGRWIPAFAGMTLLLATLAVLQGCANSAVSREAQNQVDASVDNSNSMSDHPSLSGAYQNTSQRTKGLWLGGAGGAVAGGLTSGVGILPGAATGAILGGAFGAYIDQYTTVMDQLENRHARVIVLGDQILIVLPSNELFDGRTPYLLSSAYSTLNLVAKLINGYPNMSVQVAAYTPAMGSARVNAALSEEQAQNIIKYLWRRGLNTRLLYAVGRDGAQLVSQNSPDWNEGENYRVEITLEKLPV